MNSSRHSCFGPAEAWLPPHVVHRLRTYQGKSLADQWLAGLPAYLWRVAVQWELEFDPLVPDLTFNIVLFADSPTHGHVVLKLHPPSPEFLSELHALEQSQGDGIVKLVGSDPDMAMMMLERVQPGDALLAASLDDDVTTRIAATAMRRFWRSPVVLTHLHPLKRWFRQLLEYPGKHSIDDGPVPAWLMRPALETSNHLFASSPATVLLHGDLHHGNLLRNSRDEWTIIDPKGLVGDPAYDVATWMLNPWTIAIGPTYPEIAKTRLAILEEALEIPRLRLAEWAFVHATLSICWSIEGSGEDTSNEYGAVQALFPIIEELRNQGQPANVRL